MPAVSRLLWHGDAPTERRRPASAAARSILAGAIAIGLVIVGTRWHDSGRALGWSPVPPAVIAAIEGCDGPFYNGFDEGGYLMWFVRRHRVFVDGRVEAYPIRFLLEARDADVNGNYRDLFTRYGITCAVVRAQPLFEGLRHDPALKLAVLQDGWSVFSTPTR